VIATMMSGVREQAKVTEDEIHSTIERLISLLRDREAALLSDVETIKHQKEKELQLQKDELEFLLSGIRHAVLFSEAMIKEGSDIEIVASHHQVVARMATLTREREKAQLEPVADAEIAFVGDVEQLNSAIRDLGTVDPTGISTEQSSIVVPTRNNNQINQAYSFKVILVDKKGNKISTAKERSKAVKSLAVEVAGPSTKVKVDFFNLQINFPLQLNCLFVHFLFCSPPLKRKATRAKCLCRSLPHKLVSTKSL